MSELKRYCRDGHRWIAGAARQDSPETWFMADRDRDCARTQGDEEAISAARSSNLHVLHAFEPGHDFRVVRISQARSKTRQGEL